MDMLNDKRGQGIALQVEARRPEAKPRFGAICASFLIMTSVYFLVSNLVDELRSTLKLFEITGINQGIPPTQPALFSLTRPGSPKTWQNLLVEKSSNYTSTLAKILHLNATGSSTCYRDTTMTTTLEGLPESLHGSFFFQTDTLHHLTLVAYGENGTKRCAGGDYYEVDLHDRDNVAYRSRVPTVDFGNGSYGLDLIVPSRFAGDFILEIRLLYSNWHGMDIDSSPETWMRGTLVLAQELKLGIPWDPKVERQHQTPKTFLTQCSRADFDRTTWQGRWTRTWFNETCEADSQKRFRCVPEEHYWCEEPWCFGPVGRLESNGWQYSAHCSFKTFQREEAWKCLDSRWFLMWGDSNFQDTVRNLLLFVLDWQLPLHAELAHFQLPRMYETGFVNSHRYDQEFRVSQVFNGAINVDENGDGLAILKYKKHQESLLAHFNGTRWPDTIIMTSGMHDASNFRTLESYVESVDFAIEWWIQLYESIPKERRPTLIWRTTIAPAGWLRNTTTNPNKLEMYNLVMVEKLQQVRDKLPVKIIDGFDLTFPFHYTNDYSDGAHYGRPPGAYNHWYGAPHWYFVGIMMAHIFLNAACSLPV